MGGWALLSVGSVMGVYYCVPQFPNWDNMHSENAALPIAARRMYALGPGDSDVY